MNISVEKAVSFYGEDIVKIGNWMYNWWGEKEGYTLDEIVIRLQHSLCDDRIPQTYVAKCNRKIVGIYQFAMDDAPTRPDLYPWLCNMYVEESYRGSGVGRAMLESIKKNMKALKIKTVYLYTEHEGLYEKYGFEYLEDIIVNQESVRLYMLKI
ncbi:MAG: GNAT family N-acetyltransferase [Coprobacillus sp.]